MSTSGYGRIFARHVMDIIASIAAQLTALSLWKDISPSLTRVAWSAAVAGLHVIKKPSNGPCPDQGLAYATNMDRKGQS
jgi:hypothetical protein